MTPCCSLRVTTTCWLSTFFVDVPCPFKGYDVLNALWLSYGFGGRHDQRQIEDDSWGVLSRYVIP